MRTDSGGGGCVNGASTSKGSGTLDKVLNAVQTLTEVYLFILFIVTESRLVRTRGRNRMPKKAVDGKAVDCSEVRYDSGKAVDCKSGMTAERPWTVCPI